MAIEIDNASHCAEFVRLNEAWITDALMRAAIELARKDGAETIYLLSNTVLEPATALYRKHGFRAVSEGPHPVYARCNVVMERSV